jgi:glucose/arabinose dehydrogenase
MRPGILSGSLREGAMVRRRIALVSILLALVIGFTTSAAASDQRVALVIGNSAYRTVGRLDNPVNDAAAMGELFKAAGFDDVRVATDLGIVDMKKELRAFSEKVASADIAVIYYAGHGIEIGGRNYLIPIDAVLRSDLDAEDEAVELDHVLQRVEAAKRLKLVILDACRENPFTPKMRRTSASRAIGRGLGDPGIQTGDTLVAFAARAGSTAEDGDGKHSPFASALLHHLTTPGLDLRFALGNVRTEVRKATDGKQDPFTYGDLGGDPLALVPAKAEPPKPAIDADASVRADFDLAKQNGTFAAWDAFLAHHPSGFLADLAKIERQKLAEAQRQSQRQSKYILPNGATVTWRSAPVNTNSFSITFSVDGQRIASANHDKTIKVWDAATGLLLKSFQGGGDWVYFLAFSPDGRVIASAGDDKTIRLWNSATGTLLKALAGHSGAIRSLAFSPDGNRIISASDDDTIRLWDIASGNLLETIEGHQRWVASVAFSSDGKRIATGGGDSTIKLWDVTSGRLTKTLSGHLDTVFSVAFSPDGRWIASGGADESIKIWDAANGALLKSLISSKKPIPYTAGNFVDSVIFSPDGKMIASTSSNENKMKLWDATSGALVRTFDDVAVTSIALSSSRIAAGLYDTSIKLWDATSGALVATFFADGESWAAVAADGRYVASGDVSKFLEIKRGNETLPMDAFVRLNRRDSLAEVASGAQ